MQASAPLYALFVCVKITQQCSTCFMIQLNEEARLTSPTIWKIFKNPKWFCQTNGVEFEAEPVERLWFHPRPVCKAGRGSVQPPRSGLPLLNCTVLQWSERPLSPPPLPPSELGELKGTKAIFKQFSAWDSWNTLLPVWLAVAWKRLFKHDSLRWKLLECSWLFLHVSVSVL